jgi:myo-inositol-1(or 4)-monophosphatase
MNSQTPIQFTHDLARQAGAILMKHFEGDHLERNIKTHDEDFATQADVEAEAFIKNAIRTTFPADRILGEETGWEGPEAATYSWIVDPLDGTLNFANGSENWGVMIARACGSTVDLGVIYYPTKDILISAERGQGTWLNGERVQRTEQLALADSRLCVFERPIPGDGEQTLIQLKEALQAQGINTQGLRSAAANTLEILHGRKDGFLGNQNYTWDGIPVTILLQEAGLMVTDWTGAPIDPHQLRQHFVAALPSIHGQLLAMVQVAD